MRGPRMPEAWARRLRDRRGSGLVLCLIVVAVFSIFGVAAYRLTRAQSEESVFFMRSAQAQAIAEAGLEDALHQLYLSPGWTAGFSKKPFADGYYTVTVGTGVPITLFSRGYSKPISILGRIHRYAGGQVAFAGGTSVNPGYASLSDAIFKVDGLMDAYDSTLNPDPASFGFGANIWSNAQVGTKEASGIKVRGSVEYQQGSMPKQATIEGSIYVGTYTYTLPFHDGSAYVNGNNNAAGISPTSAYNSSKKTLTVAAGTTVTMAPGNYYLNGIQVDGTLNVNASSASPVNVYLNGDMTVNGSVVNASKIPGKLNFYGQSRLTITLSNVAPIRAVFEARQATIYVNQVIYGRIVANNANINSTGIFHFDMEGKRGAVSHAGIAVSSWYTGP